MIANRYFQPFTDYFWQWEDQGEVIAIPNASSIAYKGLIADTLKHLSSQGLPPFGALLLALIATNPDGKTAIGEVETILQKHSKLIPGAEVNYVINFLYLLADVPDDYKTGNKKRLLLQAIFENCHQILAIKKSAVIAGSFDGNFRSYASLTPQEKNNAGILNDLRAISLLHKKFGNAEDIIKKIASLPEIEEEVILQAPVTSEPEDFIEMLISNDKTFKVGALIKTMWAGLNLPFHSTVPSQQPIGGISDLTNKGNYDQLLISEYANDDLIFLSRLANNEALFLRRESPPASSDKKRVILLDVSLKNWGTPKLVSFATMLAIAKHPKTDIACEAFILGESFYPLDFNSLDGIIDGLQVVESSLDPVSGLTQYLQQYPASKNREIFVLTATSTQKQFAMRKVMSEVGEQISYWILNDSEGCIDIYKNSKNNRKHIQHIELPLERLWRKTSKAKIETKGAGVSYYPVLLKNSPTSLGIKPCPTGEVFQLTKDGSLLMLHKHESGALDKGWELIYENLPLVNKDFEIGMLDNGDFVILVAQSHNNRLVIINIKTNEKRDILFDLAKSNQGQSFVFHQGKFYTNLAGNCNIDSQGNISEVDLDQNQLSALFQSRVKQLEEAKAKYGKSAGVFKNIDSVFINQSGQMCFNVHKLTLNTSGLIRLTSEPGQLQRISAHKIAECKFEFDDGSTVEIIRAGLIILKSSNPGIPTIFIPSVVDISLGGATMHEFAGNPYFMNEPYFQITLLNVGRAPLVIIKLIKELTQLGLSESKKIVDTAPKRIPYLFTKAKSDEMKSKLEEHGANIEIKGTNPYFAPCEKISTNEFFKKNIEPFIQTILSHGT